MLYIYIYIYNIYIYIYICKCEYECERTVLPFYNKKTQVTNFRKKFFR